MAWRSWSGRCRAVSSRFVRGTLPHTAPAGRGARRGSRVGRPGRGTGCASEDEAGRFYVSYLKFNRDEESEDGWSVDALYQKEHHEEFYCGELEAQLMPRMENIEPPEDLADKKAWFSAKMEVLRRRAREEIERELKEEARLLKLGKTPTRPRRASSEPSSRRSGPCRRARPGTIAAREASETRANPPFFVLDQA